MADKPVNPPSVLFVCTANICRSPMATALFKHKLAQASQTNPALLLNWRVESAGTWAREGEPASERSQLVMQGRGLDISAHRSRTVSLELLSSFNLILVMEKGHKEALKAEFPDLSNRIFMISEMAGYQRDIRDPILGTMVDYQNTARELDQLLTMGFEKILQLAKLNPGEVNLPFEEKPTR